MNTKTINSDLAKQMGYDTSRDLTVTQTNNSLIITENESTPFEVVDKQDTIIDLLTQILAALKK